MCCSGRSRRRRGADGGVRAAARWKPHAAVGEKHRHRRGAETESLQARSRACACATQAFRSQWIAVAFAGGGISMGARRYSCVSLSDPCMSSCQDLTPDRMRLLYAGKELEDDTIPIAVSRYHLVATFENEWQRLQQYQAPSCHPIHQGFFSANGLWCRRDSYVGWSLLCLQTMSRSTSGPP